MSQYSQLNDEIYSLVVEWLRLNDEFTDARVARKYYIIDLILSTAKQLKSEEEKKDTPKTYLINIFFLNISICETIKKRKSKVSEKQASVLSTFIMRNIYRKNKGFSFIPKDNKVEEWHFMKTKVAELENGQDVNQATYKVFQKIASEMWELKKRISELEKEAETVIGHNPMEEVEILLPQ